MKPYNDLIKWKSSPAKNSIGVLTGCNQNHEWLLKSWWHHFSKHNDLNVTFIDFGMSESAKLWCKTKGSIIDMSGSHPWITPKENISENVRKKWEKLYAPTLWGARACWLTKPVAFLQTPYTQNAWIDLDCIVRGNIRPLIDASNCTDGFACVREVERSIELSKQQGAIESNWIGYNAGVLSFQKGSLLVKKWAEKTVRENHIHMGDSDTLNHTLNANDFDFCELSDKFNRRPQDGILKNTLIAHYVCTGGKHALMQLFKSYQA
ncbi:hypothetical protein COB21_03320 [Candidatus Aerophobetes bacterium]|uniref:Glycosyl transferase n=1 Tax=Aerophobetes bacterium TaxID=2030807 RepID=A0A2A4X567_UNCAE|nr:MAG: hypothetical protein COB21_03320 [Candidatus Aerophobetes bacterium]